MYIENSTTSTKILADFIKTLCGKNVDFPEHQWKLEYPIGNIDNLENYNWIVKNRFAVISTEYSVEFIMDTKNIKTNDIEIDNDYLIINLLNYPKAFTQLYYNDIPMYKNEDKNKLALLEYYANNDKIYLLNQDLDVNCFKITYGKSTDQITKFYIKFSYPEKFISREKNKFLEYDERKADNKYFIKWTFGKYMDNEYNIFSDSIYKIPSKEFYSFWHGLYSVDDQGRWINNSLDEYFLTYHITYDNKSMAFIIQDNTDNTDIYGFSYIGALENCKNTITNEIDNFGSCGNTLLNQDQPWDIRGYYEITASTSDKTLSNITLLLNWDSDCSNANGTSLFLVDELFNVKLFMRPGKNVYKISNNLDGLEIIRSGSDIIINTLPTQIKYHRYFIFWYNTMGNTHGSCAHINISYIDNITGISEILNTVNINQALISGLGDYDVDIKLPVRIYDHINHQIQYDSQNHKILPLLVLDTETNSFDMYKYIYGINTEGTVFPLSTEIMQEAEDPNLQYLGKEIVDYGPIWESVPIRVNSFTEPDFIFYRTPAGGFYQEHKVAAYSMWEMDINQNKKLSFVSAYTKEQMVTKIQLNHPFEMARGYLRRVLSTPSTKGYNMLIEVNYNGNDEDFIYLKRGKTKDMFKNSNILFNTLLFQITN